MKKTEFIDFPQVIQVKTESCPTVILRLQDWLSGRILAIITIILVQIYENGKVKE